ncbi:lanthionine synthetase C family protein [Evansella halocellulosilytica]|uniref:lanthionine synthetase C family protein n=1 Tax=Evansella halocellulosilytica TaxID=2011013 RepID=UPI000BB7F029|nr:lanthionine synthetase C family protein [Evansella halocellulosilytica]
MRNVQNSHNTVKSVTEKIADVFKNDRYIRSIIYASDNKTTLNDTNPWHGISLSHGYPGSIILFSFMDKLYPDSGWDLEVHNQVIMLGKSIEKEGVGDISLFSGWTGIAHSIELASRNGERYQNFLSNVDHHIINEIDKRVDLECKILNQQKGAHSSSFDVIQGISGIASYLLGKEKFQNSLIKCLNYLLVLTQPIKINNKWVPGWYIPKENLFLDSDKENFPFGNFNIGLSHGITGPLSILSLALINGIEIKGQKEAINTIAEWLLKHMSKDQYGIFWPHVVPYEAEFSEYNTRRGREVWCYGTPGVSRSLFLAGKALRDEKLQKLSTDALESTLTRPDYLWNIDSPILCHGYAGLLQILLAMYADTQRIPFKMSIHKLVNKILELYNSDLPFGFQDIEPTEKGTKIVVNKGGLLEGSPGIALTLLSSLDYKCLKWDRCFLLN